MDSKFLHNLKEKNGLNYIKKYLPKLFQIAELDCSRDGKIGMEVGVVREKIVISLFVKLFTNQHVDTKIKINEKEIDVRCFKEDISIKTITGLKGPKLIWTVDHEKVLEFVKNYSPECSIILVLIDWEQKTDSGGFYYIPKDVQFNVHKKLKEKYFKLPKQGTNPRGVEMSIEALKNILDAKGVEKVSINWKKENLKYNPLQRWTDEWEKFKDI